MKELNLLNYMYDNDYIIISELEHWEELDPEHKKALLNCAIGNIDNKIKELVKKYAAAQKRYHGDSALSHKIEGEIDSLCIWQKQLKEMA